ncbi:hypothetical protein [Neisseria mucosa]|jgi:hypothetical protein|uniref:hypothetical protein n=1 Tax=Neisseria mucosa TaxID=488 RepID=UPI00280B010A|nr:hypothetical protein [Neisseria mucosa]
MKKRDLIYAALPAFMLAACTSTGIPHPEKQPHLSSSPLETTEATDTLIIFYDPETGSERLMNAVREYGAKIVYEYRNFNGIAIKLPNGTDMEKAASHFRTVKGVLSAEADRRMQLHSEYNGLR